MPEQVDHLLLTRMWHGRAHGLHTRLPFGLVFEYIGSRDLPFGTHTCNTKWRTCFQEFVRSLEKEELKEI